MKEEDFHQQELEAQEFLEYQKEWDAWIEAEGPWWRDLNEEMENKDEREYELMG